LLLGLEPGALGEQGDRLRRQCPLLGADLGGGEADEDLALADARAFLDHDFADDAAVTVLDRLALAGDNQAAGRLGRGIEPGEACPADKDHEEEDRHGLAPADILRGIVGAVIDRVARNGSQFLSPPGHESLGDACDLCGHGWILPRVATRAGGGAGASSRKISSRGPNITMRPSRMTINFSTTGRTLRRCATRRVVTPRRFKSSRVLISC
jgi:hypothetical protein